LKPKRSQNSNSCEKNLTLARLKSNVENEDDSKKDWKAVMKERRREIYARMKENRRKYLNQPEVKERMQIMKAKMKNKRRALMKEFREKRALSRQKKTENKTI
jgi:hypothetical protein